MGLGAYLVNLKETNPSKIAAGFGGTMNLLVSLAFSVAIVSLSGLPTLVYFGSRPSAETYELDVVFLWQVGSMAAMIGLGAAAVLTPLVLGMRAFRRMEF